MSGGVVTLLIKGAISELETNDQIQVRECAEKIRDLATVYGEKHWALALALVGAEVSDS